VSGWERPAPPGDGPPSTFWSQEPAGDALGPGQLIRRAWRHYAATPRRYLLVAAIPETIRDVLAIPSFVIALGFVEGVVTAFGEFLARVNANPAAYSADPWALQAEFEDRLREILVPVPDMAILPAAMGALGVAVGLIGTSALAAVALAAARGRTMSVVEAFRLVAARGALIKPIVVLVVGWLVVAWIPLLLQTSADFRAWAGVPGSPRSVLLASLLSVIGAVVTLLIVIVAVRWALYIPAVVAEPIGVGSALVRSAELSRGIRSRLALAMAGILLLHAFSVGLVAAFVGIAMGISADSVPVGFAAYVATSFVGNLLWAPVLPAMLALAYHTRVGEAPAATPG
jgi:hypothetical protein